ncbi:hypothetical protein Y1Q_0003054 [Alligator mississippiensis]|uniref:Uncharacterized protein n=1 Tax=Alligator mississippiensis TaxID=8496 RepID=A0A151MD90_ALLMI|nr:hypothetical protein Y1Q_0003054 [Alligator mississippiensis]
MLPALSAASGVGNHPQAPLAASAVASSDHGLSTGSTGDINSKVLGGVYRHAQGETPQASDLAKNPHLKTTSTGKGITHLSIS